MDEKDRETVARIKHEVARMGERGLITYDTYTPSLGYRTERAIYRGDRTAVVAAIAAASVAAAATAAVIAAMSLARGR